MDLAIILVECQELGSDELACMVRVRVWVRVRVRVRVGQPVM